MKLLSSGVRALSQVCLNRRLGVVASCSPRFKSHSHDNPELKHTRLHQFHISKGGKMVDFAGWKLPIQYSDMSVGASHLYTRENGSMFDVSHMLQTKIYGVDRVEFFESITVGDIAGLKDNQSLLSLFTNDDGGILDDLVVTKTTDGYLYVVSNAGCAEKDLHHMQKECEEFRSRGKDVRIEVSNNVLLAVQGPKVAAALQPHINTDLSNFYFMTSRVVTLFDVPDVRMTRCGYTGEDGFELSVSADNAVYVAERLLEVDEEVIKFAGLGARDSLRLEAGLCLYGNDIDEKITPVEAGLAWTIGKRRRELENFPGAQIIMKQLRDKPHQKRVGIISDGAPARAHTPIYDSHGTALIGRVTSGCPSPSLNRNVAMGYVDVDHVKVGSHLKLEVRKHQIDGTIVKLPFVPTKYYVEKKD